MSRDYWTEAVDTGQAWTQLGKARGLGLGRGDKVKVPNMEGEG